MVTHAVTISYHADKTDDNGSYALRDEQDYEQEEDLEVEEDTEAGYNDDEEVEEVEVEEEVDEEEEELQEQSELEDEELPIQHHEDKQMLLTIRTEPTMYKGKRHRSKRPSAVNQAPLLVAQPRFSGGISINSVPRLDRPTNWSDFYEGIRAFFILNDRQDLLEHRRPYKCEKAQWKALQEQGITYIKLRLGSTQKEAVRYNKTVYDMLTVLNMHFKPRGDAYYFELEDKLSELKLTDFENFDEYFEELKQVHTLMSTATGKGLPEHTLIGYLLRGLGGDWRTFRHAFIQHNNIIPNCNDDQVSLDDVADAIRAEGDRFVEMEEAMQAKMKTVDTKYCQDCKWHTHTWDECWLRFPEKRSSRKRGRPSGEPQLSAKRSRRDLQALVTQTVRTELERQR